jgi:hypothetical protein
MKPFEHEITEFDGHMLVNLQEGRFLIDTGSPTSFARGGRVSFGGAIEDVSDSAMGMLDADMLSRYVGTRLDGLVGMDILGRHRLTFVGSRLFVGEGVVENSAGTPIREETLIALETDDFMGIPIVSVNVNESPVRMFVDTGAKISYLDASMLSGFQIEETLHDFYPGVGEFDVGVSTVWADLNGWPFRAKFGRLPPLLQMALLIGGVDGILGRDLFTSYFIRIERGGKPVAFVPHI